jgi:hypothetical protein
MIPVEYEVCVKWEGGMRRDLFHPWRKKNEKRKKCQLKMYGTTNNSTDRILRVFDAIGAENEG